MVPFVRFISVAALSAFASGPALGFDLRSLFTAPVATTGTVPPPAAAAPGAPEWSGERRDYPLAASLRHEDGWLSLGEAPGLGIVLDEDRLKATRVG